MIIKPFIFLTLKWLQYYPPVGAQEELHENHIILHLLPVIAMDVLFPLIPKSINAWQHYDVIMWARPGKLRNRYLCVKYRRKLIENLGLHLTSNIVFYITCFCAPERKICVWGEGLVATTIMRTRMNKHWWNKNQIFVVYCDLNLEAKSYSRFSSPMFKKRENVTNISKIESRGV